MFVMKASGLFVFFSKSLENQEALLWWLFILDFSRLAKIKLLPTGSCDSLSDPKIIRRVQSGDTCETISRCMTKGHLKNSGESYQPNLTLFGWFCCPLPRFLWVCFGCIIHSTGTIYGESTYILCDTSSEPPVTGARSFLVLIHTIVELEMVGTKGVLSIDALGRICVIFVEVDGYLAEYSQSAAVDRVVGHTAEEPCPQCSFRCLPLSSGSRFANRILIH